MKKILYSILFLLIIAACIWKCGIILRPTDPDFCESQIKQYHLQDENSLEVISYGSSHGWGSFDAPYFEKQSGLSSYNYGCNWQSFNTTWLFFHDSLLTQSPKMAFVEVGLVGRSGYDRDVNGEIYYTRKIEDSEEKREYLKKCFGPLNENFERYLSYYVPFVLSHENWENIDKKSFHYHPNETYELEENKGFNPTDKIVKVNINFDCEQGKVSDDSIDMLNDIVCICKKKGIKLFLYTIPTEQGYAYDDFMNEYALKNDCTYVSFYEHFDDAGLNEDSDFYDGEHVNINGARKVTDYLLKVSVQ